MVEYRHSPNGLKLATVYRKPMSVGLVAKVCRVSKKTVLNWIYRDALKAFTTYGGHYRIWPGDLKEFILACHENNPHLARQQLIAWANSTWTSDTPPGLNEISRRFDDEKIVNELRQLDRACYIGSDWNGKELAAIFRKPAMQKSAANNKRVLPGLYA